MWLFAHPNFVAVWLWWVYGSENLPQNWSAVPWFQIVLSASEVHICNKWQCSFRIWIFAQLQGSTKGRYYVGFIESRIRTVPGNGGRDLFPGLRSGNDFFHAKPIITTLRRSFKRRGTFSRKAHSFVMHVCLPLWKMAFWGTGIQFLAFVRRPSINVLVLAQTQGRCLE